MERTASSLAYYGHPTSRASYQARPRIALVTRYLLATASVHTTAAAADYLSPDETDEVVVLTVSEPDLSARDTGDAVNVARTRLLPATVTHVEREGETDPVAGIRATLEARAVDVLLLGVRRGDRAAGAGTDARASDGEHATTPGSTTRAILGSVDVPVVVLPVG